MNVSLCVYLALMFETCFSVFQDKGPMLYNVELDVFSGRASPAWTVDRKNPYYDRISYGLGRIRSTRMGEKLGYRGFMVEMRNVFGQRAYKSVGAGSNPRMEILLLNSSPFPLEPAVRQNVMDTVYRRIPRMFQTTLRPGSMIGQRPLPVCRLPRYDPENWNVPPTILRNNCYNYATQRRTNTFAQPGRATGMPFRRPLTARGVLSATIRDGFIPLPFFSPRTFNGMCHIALVIWPGVDYHFYRLDNNMLWSHKSGKTPAKNVDDSGNLILDPRVSDRGNYVIFAGYLGNHPGARVI